MIKKINLLLILFIFILISNTISQDRMWGDSHAHVTYNAWELVNKYYPDIGNSVMNTHMSNIQDGVQLQDMNNIVYQYGALCNYGHTSTHFWDADLGDIQKFNATCVITCEYENAYMEIQKLWDGNIEIHLYKPGFTPGIGCQNPPCSYGNYHFYLEYNGLKNAYKNDDNFKVKRMQRDDTGDIVNFTPPYPPLYKIYSDHSIGRIFSKNFCWNIVGRIIHLLEDSSVPAHAHDDPHIVGSPFCPEDPDYFESTFLPNNFNNKTWQNAVLPAIHPLDGGPINLNSKTNPLRYLLYLTNQVADRFPSNHKNGDNNFTENNDNYGELLTPFYQRMDQENISYDAFGGTNPPPNLMLAILDFSYVFNMRVVASFMRYVYNQFEIIPDPPPPIITNITSNMIGSQQYGYTLFKGQTGALYSTVQGSPVLYNWNYSVCDPNVWLYWPYNYNNQIYTQSFQSSPHFLLRNASYSSFSYCPVDYAPTALHLFAKLRAYNNSGEDWSPTFRINPTTNLAGGGCPYIFVLGNDTSGGKYFTENNILHHSEFSENVNQSITDVYKLNTVPKIDSNKITIQIMETENDVNYFDQIKLFAIDHPADSKIGITESNDIVMYYSEDVSSSDYATQNFSSYNIAPYIQYGQPTPKITGLSNDFVNSHYDSTSQYSKLKSYKNRLKSKGYKGSSDSLALIGEIGSDVMVPIQPGVKDWAGSISIYTNSDTYIKPFSKRVNVSDVIIPFAQTEDIVDNIDINFNSDYAMSYFSVVPVFYEGFTKTELNLLNAVHAVNGDILSSLSEIDNEFAVMDTTAIIDLKFESIIPPDQSMVRDYVFVVNGLYTSEYGYNKNQPFRLTSNNSIKPENIAYKYRLNTNYPNPFNPKTKISYSLAKSGITKLTVYDVLGRLMNVMVNEYKSAGEYTVEFNGSHLSSGVYIYRLESNDFMDTKRMLLIK